MRTGDIITLTKAQFLKLAPLGLRVVRKGNPNTIFAYRPEGASSHYGDYSDYIEGYVYYHFDQRIPYYQPINGLWMYFNGQTKFTVIQPPRLKISKTKVL